MRLPFLPVWLLSLAGLCMASGSALVRADDAGDASAANSSTEEHPLPAAFGKSVPVSVEDLKSIQTHLTELVPQLTDCTVNLRVGRAQGTGVIVSADGLILSAAHVTGPPGKPVIIVTADGKQWDGVTLGRNNTLDASMVRIQSSRKDWPHRPLSRQAPKPGDWCLTLGHPGGYQRDRGLVLRLGRVIEYNDWLIQTDCELVGGDSGGPLFDMRGEIIGINTRIGESTQYNFHVPGSAFTSDWNRLLASEEFKSHSGAYLGIGGSPHESGEGLRIDVVDPGTPAERQGLQAGDILLTFQGQPVREIDQLIALVGEESPGRAVRITLLRDGQKEELTIRLGMRWTRD